MNPKLFSAAALTLMGLWAAPASAQEVAQVASEAGADCPKSGSHRGLVGRRAKSERTKKISRTGGLEAGDDDHRRKKKKKKKRSKKRSKKRVRRRGGTPPVDKPTGNR